MNQSVQAAANTTSSNALSRAHSNTKVSFSQPCSALGKKPNTEGHGWCTQ